ncbi:MAG: hypothetical protein ACKVG0_01400 [Alphaproteobacteria bacterium]
MKFSCALSIVFALTGNLAIAAENADCSACAEWNMQQEPFHIHGDTYYVGTEGLSSILITSYEGHVLIDGGLNEFFAERAATLNGGSVGARL